MGASAIPALKRRSSENALETTQCAIEPKTTAKERASRAEI